MNQGSFPGFVLGGTASGCGKTVATLVVLRALRDAGYDPQPAKAGPDFIDPSHHRVVADRPSRTLDTWLQGDAGARRNYHRGEGDICVVEGMMGLYDGDTSTARVAEALSLPVVLVVDASAGMESVGATVLGFREYAATAEIDVDVVGVLAQRCHGGRHEEGVREALPEGTQYLGRIPPMEGLEIPDRHLGLRMGDESLVPEDALSDAATEIRTDGLVELARTPPVPEQLASSLDPANVPTVAVARDEAFAFVYPATMERLRAGAEVETFSPVAGDPLPDCDGLYLPGGYPERFAAELAGSPALADLADAAADGLPILGECGGMMVLTRSLTTADRDDGEDYPGATEPGTTYEMAGVLPASVTMHRRYQALDHVELRTTESGPGTPPGERFRGHEFHYSAATVDDAACFAYAVECGEGIDGEHDGLTVHGTVGTYAHRHPASGAFDRFLARL